MSLRMSLEARRLVRFVDVWRVRMAERLLADFIFEFPEMCEPHQTRRFSVDNWRVNS